jgi:hypothetical protein
MSYFQWELDLEDSLDPYDPLGEISIKGDEGGIKERCTFLDNFFEAIVNGFQQVDTDKTIRIDLGIEPDDIVFKLEFGRLNITYGEQSVTILDVQKFAADLQECVKNLVASIDEATNKLGLEKRQLSKLRNYIDSHSQENNN